MSSDDLKQSIIDEVRAYDPDPRAKRSSVNTSQRDGDARRSGSSKLYSKGASDEAHGPFTTLQMRALLRDGKLVDSECADSLLMVKRETIDSNFHHISFWYGDDYHKRAFKVTK